MNESELKTAFETEMGALEQSGALMPLSLKPREAWRLLGILQNVILLRLADSPEDDVYARELAATIEARLCKTPAMKEMAERGKGGHPALTSASPPAEEEADETKPPKQRVSKRR